jgi:TatD DNase family protein
LENLIIVDSHCHLTVPEYEGILEGKLRNATEADVKYMLTISTSYDSFAANIAVAEQYDNVFCPVGIHPQHSGDLFEKEAMVAALRHDKVVAVGESGLDYFYEDPPRDLQLQLFHEMLELSNELPYVFHARDCYSDILDAIAEHDIKGGVFHCYTGSIENARKILDSGFYISISGIVTFKNAVELQRVVQYISSDRLLVETDAPFLAPFPHRGKTNEPAYVRFVAEKLAELRGVDVETIADVTTDNFFRLFGKARR